MALKKRTLQERMIQWENTRSRSRKSYIIRSWVIPYGIILLLMCSGILPFTSAIGVDVKSIGYFLVIFGPIFIFMIILFGVYSWNYWEREWAKWKIENKKGIIKVAGTREAFHKYWCLLIALYCFPFLFLLILLFFTITLFWFSMLFLIIWLFLFVSSGIFFLTTMILIKNPICGHGLISNPEKLELYPNGKQSPLKFAWQILNGKPFLCKVCGERYILEKKGDQVEIVKLERDTY
jgi:hypothetical protein